MTKRSIRIDVPDKFQRYEELGSPKISESGDNSATIRSIKKFKDNEDVAVAIFCAREVGNAPEDILPDNATMFWRGVRQAVASAVSRIVDVDGDRVFYSGRDSDGEELWTPTESELGQQILSNKLFEEEIGRCLRYITTLVNKHDEDGHILIESVAHRLHGAWTEELKARELDKAT